MTRRFEDEAFAGHVQVHNEIFVIFTTLVYGLAGSVCAMASRCGSEEYLSHRCNIYVETLSRDSLLNASL